MKVLLTGGSGFLGSFVAEQLAAEGHVVRALVRPRSDKKVLEKLPRVEYVPGAIESVAGTFKTTPATGMATTSTITLSTAPPTFTATTVRPTDPSRG